MYKTNLNLKQQILKLQERLTEKDRTNDEAIRSLRDQHAKEIQKLLTASDETKNHTIQDLIRSRDEAIQARDREIRHLREQLQKVTSEMNQRDHTIRQTCEPSIDLGNEMQRISISTRQECAHPPEIRLRWRMRKPAPEEMYAWCDAVLAVLADDVVYFNVSGRKTMYSYNINSELWSRLPDCRKYVSSFAVIDNQLTAVGGANSGVISSLFGQHSNKLYSLKKQAQQLQWVEEFPPMPTKRHSATSICTQTALIGPGGFAISAWSKLSSELTCVEVMNRETCQWSVAADMPGGMMCASEVICGDQLYV